MYIFWRKNTLNWNKLTATFIISEESHVKTVLEIPKNKKKHRDYIDKKAAMAQKGTGEPWCN